VLSTGKPVLVGEANNSTTHSNGTKESTITTEDLAVALALASFKCDPAFSLDPWDPTRPDGPSLRCVYIANPRTENALPFNFPATSYARTMFEADWLLKQLSMGVDVGKYPPEGPFPSPLPVRDLPLQLRDMGMWDKTPSATERYSRLWIVVEKDTTTEGNVKDSPHPHNSESFHGNQCRFENIALQFTDVKLGVRLMRQTRGSDGRLVDLLDPQHAEPTASDVVFAKFMSQNFEEVLKI
jgi:hypothetical protein